MRGSPGAPTSAGSPDLHCVCRVNGRVVQHALVGRAVFCEFDTDWWLGVSAVCVLSAADGAGQAECKRSRRPKTLKQQATQSNSTATGAHSLTSGICWLDSTWWRFRSIEKYTEEQFAAEARAAEVIVGSGSSIRELAHIYGVNSGQLMQVLTSCCLVLRQLTVSGCS